MRRRERAEICLRRGSSVKALFFFLVLGCLRLLFHLRRGHGRGLTPWSIVARMVDDISCVSIDTDTARVQKKN